MADGDDHRILVPVDVLGGQSVPSTIIEAFASVPVVLLGYHQVPDQTPSGLARSKHEQRARAELEELETVFEAAGCRVTTQLVFTRDRFTTFERVAIERSCDAVLLTNPAPLLDRILVAIRGDVAVDHIARLVSAVLADTTIDVTLFHVASTEEGRERGRAPIEYAAKTLEAHGVERDRIDTDIVVDRSPTDAIVDAAADHDLIVAGESRPSLQRYIFRDRVERIAKRTRDPILVIRAEYLEDDPFETNDARSS